MCVCVCVVGGYMLAVNVAIYQFRKCRPWTHHDPKAFEVQVCGYTMWLNWSDWKIIPSQLHRAGETENASLATGKSLFLWGVFLCCWKWILLALLFSFCCLSQTSLCWVLCLFLFCQPFWCFSAGVASQQHYFVDVLMLLAELVQLFQINHNEEGKIGNERNECCWWTNVSINGCLGTGLMFLTSLRKTLSSVFSPTSRRQLLYFSYSMIICQLGSSFRERNERFRSGFTDIWSQSQFWSL